MSNVPDDWGMYYSKCPYCRSTVHASESGCGCMDDYLPCAGASRNRECYVHYESVIEIAGKNYCADHAACDGCGDVLEDVEWLQPYDGDIYCEVCWEDDEDDPGDPATRIPGGNTEIKCQAAE